MGHSKDELDGHPEGASLVAAATTLAREVARNERLVQLLRKCPLDSEKGIAKAASLVQETAASQELVGAHVRALLDAIHAVRQRNEEAVTLANEQVARIDEQSEKLQTLLLRFGEIGQAARGLGELASTLRAGEGDEAERSTKLEQLLASMQGVRDDAKALATTAREQGFDEVMRQADSIVQQLAAAQNKLSLFRASTRPH